MSLGRLPTLVGFSETLRLKRFRTCAFDLDVNATNNRPDSQELAALFHLLVRYSPLSSLPRVNGSTSLRRRATFSLLTWDLHN
jgi:hypothetical protein